jgi:hypothetical protein
MTTQPKVTLSAASGYKNLVFGGEVAYSTEKSAVSNYGLALGLHAGDSQLAVHLQVRGLLACVVVGCRTGSSSKNNQRHRVTSCPYLAGLKTLSPWQHTK